LKQEKKPYFLLILFSFILLAAAPSEQEYKKLCSYDGDFCGRLKDWMGDWKEPDPTLMNMVKRYGPLINEAAGILGVDARAVAAAIITENTLNVGKTDAIQNFLVEAKITKDGKIGGREFTVGFGQINCRRAFEVEAMAAEYYKRPPRQREEICRLITTKPEESIRYVAVILREAQDIYGKAGFDVSKDIGVLTTLYNLGQVKDRAEAAKKAGRAPRVNFFGFFTNAHLDQIGELIKFNPKAPLQAPNGVVAKAEIPNAEEANTTNALKKKTKLSSNPPVCDSSPGGVQKKYISQGADAVSAEPGIYTTVGRTVDCSLSSWSLIETKTERGWIKDTELEKVTKKVAEEKLVCNGDDDCERKAKQSVRKQIIGADDNGGIDLKTTNTKGFNKIKPQCGSEISIAPKNSKAAISATDAKKLIGEMEAALAKQPQNLQKTVLLADLYACREGCYGSSEQIRKFLEDPASEKVPQLFLQKEEFMPTFDNNKIFASIRSCVDKIAAQPNLDARVSDVIRRIDRYFFQSVKEQENRLAQHDLSLWPEVQQIQDACKKYLSSQSGKTEAVGADICIECLKAKSTQPAAIATPSNQGASSWHQTKEGAILMMIRTDLYYKILDLQENNPCRETTDAMNDLKKIQDLLKEPCIETVFVPDYSIYRIFQAAGHKKVAYLPNKRVDRMKMTFNQTCKGAP